jgi:hypothetical protein
MPLVCGSLPPPIEDSVAGQRLQSQSMLECPLVWDRQWEKSWAALDSNTAQLSCF